MKEKLEPEESKRMNLEGAQEEADLLRVIARESRGKESSVRFNPTVIDYEKALTELESLRRDIEIEDMDVIRLFKKAVITAGVLPASVGAIFGAAYEGLEKAGSLSEKKTMFLDALKRGFAEVAKGLKTTSREREIAGRNPARDELDRLQKKAEELSRGD